ncbi:hypothetical protein BCV69DRAFT_295892 [Microstroma glucosiphilum]|uniref:Uncharacterized protein n=1 Tax=Pseudomicrostroma glucosiphilum TaxID=1684307 RepID=A0A316UE66_9BASI|nr:hypothetical protein BCV69DRAFT_295892 [Pseudomicrostroma glucosiphilum]PWN23567.1 hypothetical protein BCV69DRAFT_295892 [Pseudomicrostroma glucosiphilum]
MAVNYMGGANAQISRIRRKQETNAFPVRPSDRRDPASSHAPLGSSLDEAHSSKTPVSVVTQRLHAYMEQRQDSRDHQGHKPLRTLAQQQSSIDRQQSFLPNHLDHAIDLSEYELGKQRSLEQIDAVFDDLFKRKSRRHRHSHRSKRILSSHDIATPASSRLDTQPEEQKVETYSPIVDLPARHAEPDVPVIEERQEAIAADVTRFEKSMKGLFSNLRQPSTDATASIFATSALASPSDSPQPAAAIATPPRLYTPVALPLPPPALIRSSSHLNDEVQRLEGHLMKARRLLEKDLTSTWPTRTGFNT